jgi:hypothetical protein
MLIDIKNFALLLKLEEDELEKYSAQILLNALQTYADCKKSAFPDDEKLILNKTFSLIKKEAESQSDDIFQAKKLYIKAQKIRKEYLSDFAITLK